MQNQLFRQKSVDRISSPEQLHDYMRVTSPRLWMLLAAILVLLIGFVAYAATTRMESTAQVKLTYYSDTLVMGEIPPAQADLIAVGMPVRMAGRTGRVDNLIRSARYLLTFTPENSGSLTGEYYCLTVGESSDPESPDTPAIMVHYQDGKLICPVETPGFDVDAEFNRGEVRVRLWNYEIDEDLEPVSYSGGYLGTVSRADSVVATQALVVLDNASEPLEPGIYDAEIVTENTTPISFLFN